MGDSDDREAKAKEAFEQLDEATRTLKELMAEIYRPRLDKDGDNRGR